jgi:hypothetical protein
MKAHMLACALALAALAPAAAQDLRDAEPEAPAVRRREAAKPAAPRRATRPRRAAVATVPEEPETRSPSWDEPHDELPPPPHEPEDRILIRRFAGRRFSFRVPR